MFGLQHPQFVSGICLTESALAIEDPLSLAASVSDDLTPEQRKAIDDAMAEMLQRLASVGWVESSYLSGPHLRVRFTATGQRALLDFARNVPKEIWPRSETEAVCLAMLCELAEQG